MDQQGRVHNFQTSQADSRNMKPTEHSTISLPGQTQATLAVASPSRTLIVDADGQAWSWKPDQAGNTKPSPIMQDQGVRIIQATALDQGLLLLDADGQAWYLADSTTSAKAANLPESTEASRISASNDQAIITDKDGRLWFWKSGEAPTRADSGNQHHLQAVRIGSRIAALDRQGSLYQWSIDAQGQPGKPAKIDSTTAPTLESASLDGQDLTLSKTGDAWQADVPARDPGPAIITITGRQDDKPFTKSLDYSVDQTLTRDTQPGSIYTVTFDTTGGSQAPQPQQVTYPFGRVQRPYPDPTRNGYEFGGWFIGKIAYDFSKPVTSNLTISAKWTYKDPNNTWKISPDKGSQLGGQQTTITPPTDASGVKFNQVNCSQSPDSFSPAVGSDGNAYAWGGNSYGQLGDGTTTKRTTPVKVKKPAGVSTDFNYMQVSAGWQHSLGLGSDGYVYAWGGNSYGQLGNNTSGSYSAVPVRVRDPASPTDASKGLKAIQVSAGYYHSLAVDKDGNIWAWGLNKNGQLGDNTNNFTEKANPFPKRVQLDSTGANTGLKAIQVSGGGYHSLAIDEDGNTWAWGYNYYGQLGNNTNSEINDKANPNPQKVLLNPTEANTVLKAVQVSGGDSHSLAIDENGTTWAWGNNGDGRLGDNTTNLRLSPVKVAAYAQHTNSADTWLNSVQVRAGWQHSLAIDMDGNAKAWGDNSNGQVGNTDAGSLSLVPTPVMFPLQPVITAAKFDTSPGTNLTHVSNSRNVTVVTPAHEPGPVTVSVDYKLGDKVQKPDTSLTYTYKPLGVLPRAGGEGILLALATGMTSMGAVLASRRHRRETQRFLHTSHE